MSSFLTAEMAVEGIDLADPSIAKALMRVTNRNEGHVRVSKDVGNKWQTIATRDYGDRSGWKYPYDKYATAKERLSQRTRMSSRAVLALHPELIKRGDTIYPGSVVNDGKNVVVAFSGVEDYFDEMFANWTLIGIQGLLNHLFAGQRDGGLEFFA